jgi:hypothetical protein
VTGLTMKSKEIDTLAHELLYCTYSKITHYLQNLKLKAEIVDYHMDINDMPNVKIKFDGEDAYRTLQFSWKEVDTLDK